MKCYECRFFSRRNLGGETYGRCNIQLPPVLTGLMRYVDSSFEEHIENLTPPGGSCDLGRRLED